MPDKKMPTNAKLVFKGILHDIYQWEQEMFDGNFTTFEAIKRKPSVTVIATTEDQRVIVIRESQPHNHDRITLPGGISEDDNLLANAKRELQEETGYTSSEWIQWDTVDILDYSKMEWNSVFFIAKRCKKMAEQCLDPGERIAVDVLNFDDFINLIVSDNFSISYIQEYARQLITDSDNKALLDFRELVF